MNNKNNIENKVENLINTTPIIDLESKIIKILQEIEDNPNRDNLLSEETIRNIENYLFLKKQDRVLSEDIEFIQNLANTLRKQEVRLSDKNTINCISEFKITTINNEDIYFLTREASQKYIEQNSNMFDKPRILHVTSQNNIELLQLLEIIKRNF